MIRSASFPVDPSNADALAAWDGEDGAYWAAHGDVFDRSVSSYDARFLAAAGIRSTDRVLDIGCGTGQSSRHAAELAHDGSVVAIDLSSAMLAVARRRAAEQGLDHITFLHADAQAYPFENGTFDVAISRTGAMFFGHPRAAFANIATALRPGDGRLTLLTWQAPEANEWISECFRVAGRHLPLSPAGAPGPFSLADREHIQHLLKAAGFTDVRVEGAYEDIYFGGTADAAFELIRGLGVVRSLLDTLPENERAQALAGLRASVEAHTTANGVAYKSAAWITTAIRP